MLWMTAAAGSRNEPTGNYEESAAGCWSRKLQQMITESATHVLGITAATGCRNESTKPYEESAKPHTCCE